MATSQEKRAAGHDFEMGTAAAAEAVYVMLDSYAEGSAEREVLWCAWKKLTSKDWRLAVREEYVVDVYPEPVPAE